jgi:hypothetical protein
MRRQLEEANAKLNGLEAELQTFKFSGVKSVISFRMNGSGLVVTASRFDETSTPVAVRRCVFLSRLIVTCFNTQQTYNCPLFLVDMDIEAQHLAVENRSNCDISLAVHTELLLLICMNTEIEH